MQNENHDIGVQPDGVTSPHGEFPVDNARVIRCLVIAAVLCLASLAFVVAGALVTFPEPVLNKRILTIAVGGCGAVLSILLFASNWRKYGQRVEVFADGFRFQQGVRELEVLWDDIAVVWHDSATIGRSRALVETNLTIETNDGETIFLTSFLLDMPRLVDIVLTETARRMVPAMWSKLQQGQTVAFGKIVINTTELVASGNALAWSEVQAIQVVHGSIDILQKNGNRSWHYAAIKSVPNFHVFLKLAKIIRKNAGTA